VASRAAAAVDAWLTRRRVVTVCATLLVVNAALAIADAALARWPLDMFGTPVLPDLVAHVAGGQIVAAGRASSLYDVNTQHVQETALTGDPSYLNLYLSPPFVAALYAPLSVLPYRAVVALWTMLSLALLAWSLAQLRACTAPRVRNASLFLLVTAASQPLFELLGSGQDTALSLAIWATGVRLSLERRDAAAGAVFGLGAFKPQLFVLPPLVFLVLRRWRAALSFVAVASGAAVASLAVAGPRGLAAWLALLQSPAYLDGIRLDRGWKMHGIVSLAASTVPPGARAIGEALGAAIALILLAITCARIAHDAGAPPSNGAREEHDARAASSERSTWAMAALAALLCAPHVFVYDLLLLIVPAALLARRGLGTRDRVALAAIFALTWTASARATLAARLPWPATLLGASWTALPMWALWRGAREVSGRSPGSLQPPRCTPARSGSLER
jgi:hypothetical protein